ncbi:MAG: hypothetical protein M3R25_02855 [Bacteroidota bacterium]|nr:hypothetical protein [Bacteroidota bacterium]
MLGSIGTYLFEKEKSKRLHNRSGSSKGYKHDKKNSFGLLLDGSNPDDRNVVVGFAEQLRREGHRVRMLGFVESKMEGLSISFDVFTSQELTRFSKIPKSSLAEAFMEQPFDVLINMSIKFNHKPLDYISAVSHASFRIGPWYADQQNNPYDLCVDAGSTASLKDWIRELMHTLQKIY